MIDLNILIVVLLGVANILDRRFIAARAEEATKAAAEERLHLIHMIAAKTPAEVVTLERSTKPPVPKDPERPAFRANPIS